VITASALTTLLAAAGLLLVAHIVRAARWALLFPSTYLTQRYNLLLGLGIGYLIDTVVPLRIGELARILLVHRRDRIRLSHVAATVFIERVTDLLVVGCILAAAILLRGTRPTLSWAAPVSMVIGALLALTAAYLVRHLVSVRRAVWRAASLFNERLRVEVADFCWSAAEIATGPTLVSWRFVTASLVMWTLYLSAYYTLGAAAGVSPLHVVNVLLNKPLGALIGNVSAGETMHVTVLLVAFAVLPILIIVLYGTLPEQRRLASRLQALRAHGTSGVAAPPAARKRFEAAHTYDYFLTSLFSGANQFIAGFSLDVGDCIIHKFFNGGSDAVTALVTVDQRLVIRKFATGSAARKLRVQAEWLRQHCQSVLPLVDVAAEQQISATYLYDMPLVTPSNDFYDVIHTSPPAHSSALLKRIVEQLDAFHSSTRSGESDDDTIGRYLSVKAVHNAQTALSLAQSMITTPSFVINGKSYDFEAWERLLDASWLAGQIRDRTTSCVHGDLTIENIVIAPGYPLGFFIIDPNSENIFDSPLIDWAKLMQSLHLGYETLNQGITCTIEDNVVRLADKRSQTYAQLHRLLEAEACARLGPDALREIYFHEIVNYLRLTSYKIRQSPTRGFGFFACTTILLDRYCERFT
jgi:Lysylphosphatidylglycerol synthase TM region/Phosphotransferase enzyme family